MIYEIYYMIYEIYHMKYISSSFSYRFLSVKTRNEISETDMVSFRQNFHLNDLIHSANYSAESIDFVWVCGLEEEYIEK